MKGSRKDARHRRRIRGRKHLNGTSERPRLSIYRSNKYIYAQVIDDHEGKTLAAASSQEADLRKERLNVETAAKVGTLVADRAREAGVTAVVFDRSGYKYHGRLKALADAAREAGLEF
ncbi:MAG: 50S ribosomal protein L18 [Acidimicrobiia bacterium]|jgi:large subunit ribosomal protein L18